MKAVANRRHAMERRHIVQFSQSPRNALFYGHFGGAELDFEFIRHSRIRIIIDVFFGGILYWPLRSGSRGQRVAQKSSVVNSIFRFSL